MLHEVTQVSFLTMRSRKSGTVLEPIPACSSCTNATFEIAGRFRGVEVASYAAVHPTRILDLGTKGATPGSTSTPAQGQSSAGQGTRGPVAEGTQSSGNRQDGTRAEIGTPDMRGLSVGGPSAAGQAKIAGIQLAFMGANFVLNLINDKIQQGKAEEALRSIEPELRELRRTKPQLGILLVFFYSQVEPPPDSLVQPGPVFGHIEKGVGVTRDEARAQWLREPQLRPAFGRDTKELNQEVWIPPVIAPSVRDIRTPFPGAAVARFAPGKAELQDVEWGGLNGFDDEGTSKLTVPPDVTAEFLVLKVPNKLRFYNGTIRVDVDIPIISRSAASGGSVQVVDLDPVMIGKASAACVFPANDATDALFSGARGTKDNLDQLGIYTNFHRVRWVRPENLVITSTI